MVRWIEPLLGTRAEVAITTDRADHDEAISDTVIAEAERLEAIFTVFDPGSALQNYRLTGATDVPELVEVLALAEQWRQRSKGAFNPQIETLVGLWDSAAEAGSTPTTQQLTEAVSRLKHQPIDNLNAIAKGWIAERALGTALARHHDSDVETAWIGLGGDIVHVGSSAIRVGIEDPARPYDNAEPMATIQLQNEAMATSGGGRRYWTIDGTRYTKVLDPRTGAPVDRIASATVVAPSAADADVLATVGLVMAQRDFLELLETADACALLVMRDGSISASSGRFELTPSQST